MWRDRHIHVRPLQLGPQENHHCHHHQTQAQHASEEDLPKALNGSSELISVIYAIYSIARGHLLQFLDIKSLEEEGSAIIRFCRSLVIVSKLRVLERVQNPLAMATRLYTRSLLLAKPRQALTSLLSRSLPFSSAPASAPRRRPPPSLLLRRSPRPLSAASAEFRRPVAAAPPAARSLATRSTPSSLDDPSPDWPKRLFGCDLEHWLVLMEKPEGDPTRDDIIDSYIKTLAQVVGSEEEARMKIYSVSTRYYYAFGALVSEELSHKLKDLPRVRWVLPDSYHDDKTKDYGGEPFVNGQAVPYDPKYHEGWERNTARANERKRRNDRPHNFDRSSNFERRRENMQSRDFQGRDMPPMHNQGLQNPPPQGNMPPPNMGGGMAPPSNFGGMPPHNQGGMPPNNYGGVPPCNQGGMPPNNFGGMPPQNNMGGMLPQNNMGGLPSNNMGEMPPQSNMGGMPYTNMGGMPSPDMAAAQNVGGFSQNQGWSNTTTQRDTGNMPNYQEPELHS
ncbi:hypothetical protein NL676_000606 [Syzygium grande]|nr:hypothetical protein NL676_000606 [Syzygium grande]